MSRKRIFLIDGNSYAYRAFFAIPHLSTSRGEPTNAIYGFAVMLLKLFQENSPDYVAAAFDLPEPTFRHKEFAEYKANRPQMPDALQSQIPKIKELLAAFNVPVFELAGFEADDVIATLAKRAEEAGLEVFILTPDKDALQLVNDNIKVISPSKEGIIFDREEVEKKFGVPPERIPDFMALVGDKIDNIPGVPGIGEKRAKELMEEFASLEELLENLDRVKNAKIRALLEEYAKQACDSKYLAQLDTNVPLEIDLEECRARGFDTKEVIRLFREWEFKKLLKELGPIEVELKGDYRVCYSRKEAEKIAEEIFKAGGGAFEFDIEGEGRKGWIKGVAISTEVGKACFVPYRGEMAEIIRKVLEAEELEKYGHDLKKAILAAANEGVELQGVAFDTMVGAYLLNPSLPNSSLADVVFQHLGIVMGELTGGEKELSLFEEEEGYMHICQRAELILRLKNYLEEELSRRGQIELMTELEMPLVGVLARMERRGVRVDADKLHGIAQFMAREIERLEQEIYEIAGTKFNINSPRQLAEVLFERIGLKPIKRTKTGYSTDGEVLEKLAQQHILPAKILEYRQYAKMKSTYVDPLPTLIDPATGRVHTTFNQTITATGRLSSSNPNLQNIPIRDELGRKLREAFIAPEGFVLMSADYSQIELRILAHLCDDENLCDAFLKGEDIHTATAAEIFGVLPEHVTPQMRRTAKMVNYGVIYGMSPFGLAKGLGISVGEARDFIERYFERFRGVQRFIEKTLQEARQQGYVSTIMGRRRYLPDINSPNVEQRRFAERTAINAPVQGSAADIIKKAMIEIDRAFSKKGFKGAMILQVHDELLFELAEDELEEAREIVVQKMEGAVKLKVPIVVDVGVGRSWAEAH